MNVYEKKVFATALLILILIFPNVLIAMGTKEKTLDTAYATFWMDSTFQEQYRQAMKRISKTTWEKAKTEDMLIVMSGSLGYVLEKIANEMEDFNDAAHLISGVGWAIFLGLLINAASIIYASRIKKIAEPKK